MDSQLPRLPPRPSPNLSADLPPPQLQQPPPVRRPSVVELPKQPAVPTDIPPYDEPSLAGAAGAAVALVVVRGLLALWAIAVAVLTIVLRFRAQDGPTSTGPITVVTWIGGALACLLAVAGWWWSDRYVIDIHRLGGRLPGRARCVTAWLTPLVATAVLAATVVRLDATEGFDVRPTILVVVFAVAMWRPYSLCRRMIRSLTRVPSDVLVGAAYVFDLAGFGLMWWHLSTWPRPLGPDSVGSVDALVGIGLASAVALSINAALWPMIARTLRSGLLHRRVARRTQHDHRHLRLRGIDPMDPNVRWALLKIHRDDLAEQERRLSAQAAPDDRDDAVVAAGDAWSDIARPPLDSPAGAGRARLAARRRKAAKPITAGRDTRSIDDASVHRPVAAATTDGASMPRLPERDVVEANATQDAPVPDAAAGADGPIRHGGVAPEVVMPAAAAIAEEGDALSADDRLNKALDRIRSSDARSDLAGGDRLDRISSRWTGDDLSAEQRRLDRIAERLAGGTGGVRGPANLMDRLAQFGISPSSSPIQDDPVLETVDPDRPVMRRIPYLEFARYLMLLTVAVATGAAAWLVVRAAAAGVENGAIPPEGVDSIEFARHVLYGALTIMLATVPAWALAVAVAARRCGVDTAGLRARVALLTLVAASACVTAFVVDFDRSRFSLIAVVIGAACAVLAVDAVRRIDDAMAGGSSTLRLWSILMAGVPFALWSGQLGRPVRPDDQLESVLFVAAVLTMMLGVALVLAAVATGAIEERIRFASAVERLDDRDPDRDIGSERERARQRA